MKILGIGNALTDILVPLKQFDMINALNLPHGGMVMIDEKHFIEINNKIKDYEKSYSAGGSAANTIYGLAKLGVETSFIGKVGNDEIGKIYENDMISSGVKPCLIKTDTPSGCAIVFVTEDSERTFASYLGAAQEMKPENITEDIFFGYDILHVEGYLLFNYDLVEAAMKMAKKLCMKVSLDLAAHNFVNENRPQMQSLLKNYVDICFANEEEAKALTGLEPRQALDFIADYSEYAVVKLGASGSLIKHSGNVYEIPTDKVKCVDTTGAGDLYASGVLYGISNGFAPDVCGKIGSILGGAVVQNYGARINDEMWQNIKMNINNII